MMTREDRTDITAQLDAALAALRKVDELAAQCGGLSFHDSRKLRDAIWNVEDIRRYIILKTTSRFP